ncbi:MAG: hypothetical protein ACTSXE_05655 [Candidatus Thorarchaeota archaeon]
MSTSSVIREILDRYPTLYRSMQLGVLNYSAAARLIQEEVEVILQRSIELNTIVASFVRMTKSIDDMPVIDMRNLFLKSRVTVTTGISQIDIRCTPEERLDIVSVLNEMELYDVEHLSIHQFSYNIRILCSTRDSEMIQEKIGKTHSLSLKDGCALVNIKLHNTIDDDITSIALIFDLLNKKGINILANYSVQDDILIVVKERDVARAMEVLRSFSRRTYSAGYS